MFDTNAFDKAIGNVPYIKKYLDRIEIFITTIQIKEIANIPDCKKKTRIDDFLCLAELRPKLIPCIFTFDHFDFAHPSFKAEPSYWKILKENKGNQNDALIAATSIHEGCILITNDSELKKKVQSASGRAKSFEELMKMLEGEIS